MDGRAYYDKIDVMRGGIPVRFLLIPKARKDDPDTFYIMEDKVWVGLYRLFAEQGKEAPLLNPDWNKLTAKVNKKDVAMNSQADDPVMGVPAPDAALCRLARRQAPVADPVGQGFWLLRTGPRREGPVPPTVQQRRCRHRSRLAHETRHGNERQKPVRLP